MTMRPTDMIVAPATPPGEGGIAIVRLSGAGVEKALDQFFTTSGSVGGMRSHQLYHGQLQRPDGRLVDDVLAVVMRAPHSYTGEDVVEVHCHGGNQILRCVLDLFLEAGLRMARPGEFTERAFMNGRLDLAQAEAVAGLISARSEQACRVALAQLEGRLSRLIHDFAAQLKDALALVEAHIDFPDDEVGSLDRTFLEQSLAAVRGQMQELAASFDTGRALRDGISILILGKPNVGKSSLMNALLGQARAIVTDVPGTTRDTVEEQMVIGGFPVHLIDTAGIRETLDPIEREGVQRARDRVKSTDLILLVIDGSQALTEEDHMALKLCDPARTLIILNKVDLGLSCDLSLLAPFDDTVQISVLEKTGLDQLQEAMVARLAGDAGGDVAEHPVITERRHRDALLRCLKSTQNARELAGNGAPLELLALEIREGLDALGQITGETTPEEILNHIFSRFCVGK